MVSILVLALAALLLAGLVQGASDSHKIVTASEILAKIERGEPVNYDGVIVVEDLDLSGRTLEMVHFNDTVFQGSVNFRGANFTGDAWFLRANFNGDANFWKAVFSDYADFQGAEFNGYASFWMAVFSDYAGFWWAVFSGYADFVETKFGGYADFSDTEFNKIAGFDDATFDGSVSFEDAQFSANAFFENTTFSGDLDLTRTGFLRLFLHWRSVEEHQLCVSDDDAYLALMRNYVNLGWFEDSNNCYYEYRNKRRVSEPISFERVTDSLEWFLYGYGVKPHYTLTWIAISVLIFGLAFRNGGSIRKYIKEEREVDLTDETIKTVEIKTVLKRGDLTFIDPFLFSLTTFTSGFTSFLYPSYEYRAEKHKCLVILERLLGSVFLALLITAISKTYLIR